MGSNRSFKEYIADRFEDKLFDKTQKFILENRFLHEFTTRKIEHPSSTEVDKIRVITV